MVSNEAPLFTQDRSYDSGLSEADDVNPLLNQGAVSSAVERSRHMREVVGSIPTPPTKGPRRVPLSFIEHPDKKSAIYIFECGEFIKVGMTTDVERRRQDILATNPFDLRLAYYRTVHFAVARETELAVLAALKQFHHRGEWFRISAKAALPHLKEAWNAARRTERRFRDEREAWLQDADR